MSREELLEILSIAIKRFYENDFHLIDNEASERSIIASIQCNLKKDNRINCFDIDVEYNREGNGTNSKRNQDGNATTADLLIHTRSDINGETEKGNLLYLEAKTDFNISNENKIEDIKTIIYFKKKFNYKYGAFMEIGKHNTKITFYNRGGKLGESHIIER